jgi:Raf kinase inhibitor-like YbhB/YbcL family protein
MHLLLSMLLTSTTFVDGTAVPATMVSLRCGGENVSPALTWSGAPRGTESFAIIVHDTDAPRDGGFYHWVAYGIAANERGLAAGSQSPAASSGRNDAGTLGYTGPCPPPGKVHHYHVTLYALDDVIETSEPLDAAGLLERMKGHILAQAEIVGLFSKS